MDCRKRSNLPIKLLTVRKALVKVQSDILNASAKQENVLLSLLHSSAAFDTVDHIILLNRLRTRYGIKGNALQWFASNLTDRWQFIRVKNTRSSSTEPLWGVLQGSVFAPILYKRSTAPLADIIQKLGLLYHLHADDCQIYVSFKSSPDEVSAALAKLEDCASEIYAWMAYNKLKLNCEKTGFLVIHAKHCPCPPIDEITIAGVKVEKSIKARNIGVIFDSLMDLEQHIDHICKMAFCHIRSLSRIRNCLSLKDMETLVHVFITTKLDNCNSLLAGLPQYLIDKLQHVHNALSLPYSQVW